MPDPAEARQVGADAVHRLRSAAGMLADLLQRDPERMAMAVKLGLVRGDGRERPGEETLGTARPDELLERAVQRRPSTLDALRLTAIEILSSAAEDETGEGVPDTLTVVFTDIVGFTRFNTREGDEAASHLLAEHHRAVGPIVRRRGGRMVKHLGDGLLLTFLEPEAAVLAGLELVEAPPGPLRLRIGLHVGEVLVLRHHDVIGQVVNVAARVTELARGGQVLATAAVRDSAHGLSGVSFGRVRRRRLKGVGESVPVCAVRRS